VKEKRGRGGQHEEWRRRVEERRKKMKRKSKRNVREGKEKEKKKRMRDRVTHVTMWVVGWR